jgi:hypothetical protein
MPALDPNNQDFDYYRGEHVVVDYTAPEEFGDITGWSLAFWLVRPSDGVALIVRTTDPGGGVDVTDGPGRTFRITIPKEYTASSDVPAGFYTWEVARTDGGAEDRIASGNVEAQLSQIADSPPIPTPSAFPITVPFGGTGASEFPAGRFLIGSGTSAVATHDLFGTINTFTADQRFGAILAGEVRDAADTSWIDFNENELLLFAVGEVTITGSTGGVTINPFLTTGSVTAAEVVRSPAVRTTSLQDGDAAPVLDLGTPGVLGVLTPIRLPHLADPAAPVDSTYYSTTAGKLAYKDTGGVVHPLY